MTIQTASSVIKVNSKDKNSPPDAPTQSVRRLAFRLLVSSKKVDVNPFYPANFSILQQPCWSFTLKCYKKSHSKFEKELAQGWLSPLFEADVRGDWK